MYIYIYNEIGLNGNKTFRLLKFYFTFYKILTDIYTKKTYFSQVGANAQ